MTIFFIKGKIDFNFLKSLFWILRLIPSQMKSSQAYDPLYLLFFLCLRTFFSVYLARINGKIVKDLINRSGYNFSLNLLGLILCAIPSSFLNHYITYLERRIRENIQLSITKSFYDDYLEKLAFYDVKIKKY